MNAATSSDPVVGLTVVARCGSWWRSWRSFRWTTLGRGASRCGISRVGWACRSIAVAVGTAAAAGGYIVQGLAQQVQPLHPIRAADPWHWLIDANPLAAGLTWQAGPLPLAVSLIQFGAGAIAVRRRDLH